MSRGEPQIPVLVCRVAGHDGQYFGKFKDPADGKWKKIPGGPFPPEFNTKPKAQACARRWYQMEMAERQLVRIAAPKPSSWSDICDAFVTAVQARLRGSDGTRNKSITIARTLKRYAIFSSKPPAEHDEAMALVWLREFAREPKRDGSPETRHPFTIRNTANLLRDIYRWARSSGSFPKDKQIPADGDEFKAEIKYLLGTVKKREVMCPISSITKLLTSRAVPEFRRLLTHVYVLTGLRPGELHGLRYMDVKSKDDVQYFDVNGQWTLTRGLMYPSKRGPLKTRWSERQIPIHPSLVPVVTQWMQEGWRAWVGRDPDAADYLFPDQKGEPFREERSTGFVADLASVGCPTDFNGIPLTIYSLRHTFSTMMLQSHVDSDARDRLLGHRPKDTKSLAYEVTQLTYLHEELAKVPAVVSTNRYQTKTAETG